MSGAGFELVASSRTDVGRIREENQDAFGAFERPGFGVMYAVADGMGGAPRRRDRESHGDRGARGSLHGF